MRYFIIVATAIVVVIPTTSRHALALDVHGDRSNHDAASLVSCANGDAIVVWREVTDNSSEIKVQKLDPTGELLWKSGGIGVAREPLPDIHYSAATDGSGGVIVTWEDSRKGIYDTDIYAQRVSRTGSLLWPADGVPLCTAPHQQELPESVPDKRGGVFAFWTDYRNGNADIFGCHVNSAGETNRRFSVCSEKDDQLNIAAAQSVSGGVCIVWVDHRYHSPGIYAQYIGADDELEWPEGGLPVCTGLYQQESPSIAGVGKSGFVIAWTDYRDRLARVFTRVVGLSGTMSDSSEGDAVTSSPGPQYIPSLCPVDSSAAVVTWLEYRRGAEMFQSRVDPAGASSSSTAYPISEPSLAQFWSKSVTDGRGGAVAAWLEYSGGRIDVFAQRTDKNGQCLWGKTGVLIGAAREKTHPSIIFTGNTRDFRVAWAEMTRRHPRVAVARVMGDGKIAWKREL